MKKLFCIALLILFVPVAVQAAPTKADCKAYLNTVRDLAKDLAVTDDINGRDLLNTVNAWIAANDDATIIAMIENVDAAVAGIKECEAAGHGSRIMPIKPMAVKMENAILPWLRSSVVTDPCQSLISQAVGKIDTNPDEAIAELEKSVAECDDDMWVREARRRLTEIYYGQGNLAKAHEHTRGALALGASFEEEDRKTFFATMAKPTLEAGQALMEAGDFEAARQQWTAYVEIFGSPSFDVLFDVEAIAKTAWRLRELGDAERQLAVACLELGDAGCVRETALADLGRYAEDDRPLTELAARAAELGLGGEGDDAQLLAIELLDAWHGIDPDSFQIDRLLDEKVVGMEDEARRALLRSTDKCWIPLHVAEALKENELAYLEEMEIASACGGSSAEAATMLADFYMREANDRIDRIGILGTVGERQAAIRAIEKELLPKIADAAMAAEVKTRLTRARSDLQRAAAQSQRDLGNSFAACTEMLALIQWNMAREEDYFDEEDAFKKECCRFLKNNASGWGKWMRSRPEGQRLVDEEIEKKERLMQGYCP
jgi:tetratricopeptide (TPR) repeat protein